MKITQIRNATLIVEYDGKRFLIDPMLSDKGALPPFAGTPNDDARNPLVDLPLPMETIIDVDAVIVTHTHKDHWDDAAAQVLPKAMPVFVQHEQDAELLRSQGFEDLRILSQNSVFEGVELIKTPGQHGSDAAIATLGDRLGQVCGVVFRAPSEKTLYVAGDTVWNTDVADNLAKYAPKVVALNCGYAIITLVGPLIMGTEDLFKVAQAAPTAFIVATHMEAVNHATLSRSDLQRFTEEKGIAPRVFIPQDGASLLF